MELIIPVILVCAALIAIGVGSYFLDKHEARKHNERMKMLDDLIDEIHAGKHLPKEH